MRNVFFNSESRIAQLAKATAVTAILSITLAAPIRAEGVGNLNIKAVRVSKAGDVLLTFPAGSFNAGGYLVIPAAVVGRKDMLSIATAAVLSGKPVWVNRAAGQTPAPWGITDHCVEIQIAD